MSKLKYLRKLDYIRIVSCIIVLLYHLNILKGGYLAVCTFFVMSGYLNTKSFLKDENFSLKTYFLKRIKRIYIPLLLVTFSVIILATFIPTLNWLNLKPESLSVIGGYNNIWQLNANLDYFTRHVDSPFMHFWYIAILLQFEIIFPFIAILIKKLDDKVNKHLSTVIILLLLFISTMAFLYMGFTKDIMFVYYSTLLRFFSIFYGIMAGLIIHKHQIKLPEMLEKKSSIIFSIYLFGIIILSIFVNSNSIYYPVYMLIATIISSRLVRYSYIESKKSKAIDYITKFFANITYEVYLIQYPVIYAVQKLLTIDKYNIPIILASTFILSCILHIITSTQLKYKVVKAIQVLIIISILTFGTYNLVIAKDYTAEMNELEAKLNENLALMDQQNNSYLENVNNETVKWEEQLKQFESGENAIKEYVNTLPVVGVGDSVLLAASPGLKKYFPNGYFDGKVSRTILGGKDVLAELEANEQLGDIIICALANNGDYILKRNKDFMEFIGNRQVFWVDAVLADIPEFNAQFEEFAKDYTNLHIVHWEEASKDHPEYFYADGIHVKGDGIEAYGKLVYEAVCDYFLKDYREKSNEVIKEHEQKQKQKICFYGNRLLINLYDYIKEEYSDALFESNIDYNFDKLFEDIKFKKQNNILESNIVLVFDSSMELTYENLLQLKSICDEIYIYIINTTEKIIKDDNDIFVIDFYEDIKENPRFILPDNIHISKEGYKTLANKIKEIIK